jgi:zinc protease
MDLAREAEGLRRFRLDNGMRVTLLVNRSAPLVEVHLYVLTGYSWEPDELQGISHVVEHNLMHASPRRATRAEFARDRRAMGAWYDAGTTYDYTEYLLLVRREHLDGALEMLADGFFSPIFREDVFRSEMGAILQESRRKQDIPEPMVLEKLYSAAYRVHRRRRWRLGTAESLGRLTVEDLRRYFADRYGPGNIVCTIGGDLDLEVTERRVREVFGAIPAAPVRGEPSPAEPEQQELRYLELSSSLGRVYWICGFHTPEFLRDEGDHWIELIAALLGGGRGSRLMRAVVEPGLADRLEVRAPEFDEYMMLNVYMETDPERFARAEAAVLEELFALASQPPDAGELARARMRLQSAALMRCDDLRRHVEWLAVFEGRGGDLMRVESRLQRIAESTPADLQRAAERYLRPERMTICLLRPEALAPRPRAGALQAATAAAERAADRPPRAASPAGDLPAALPGLRAIRAGIAPRPQPPLRRQTADGGVLVFQPSPGNPVFALAALVRGGRVQESPEQCGITDLTTAVLLKGAGGRDASQLASLFEDLGVRIDPLVLDDAFGFLLYGPVASAPAASAALLEILSAPSLPPEAVEVERRRLIGRRRGLADRARQLSLARFREELFRGHAYGLPRPGDIEALQGIDRDEVAAWHQALVRRGGIVLAMSGDLEPTAGIEQLAELAERLPAGSATMPWPEAPRPVLPREISVPREFNQTSTIVGVPTVPAGHPDSLALDLIAAACSGDGGRFYDEIRSRRGLAYVVHAVNTPLRSAGMFFGFSATAPDKAAEAREIFLREFQRLVDSPPEGEELRIAVEYCLGMRAVRHRRNSLQRTLALAEAEILDRGIAWERDYEALIRGLTAEDLARVTARYFGPENRLVLTVGKSGDTTA